MFGSKNKLNENLLPSQQGAPVQEKNLERVNTFADEGINRQYTFSRAFTFDGAALQRHVSQPFEGLARTITTVGNRFDPDAKFTNSLLEEINTVSHKGNEGDLPISPGFARTRKFWRLIFYTVLLAGFMAVAASLFMNVSDQVPRQWVQCNYDDDVECGDWYGGKHYFIAIPTCTGFLIGLIRYLTSYPDNLPGIFKDINTFHVDPKWIPITYAISMMSLAGGATLGPEQALGNLGGGIAYYISHIVDFEDEDYDKIYVLAGMASALGALFPTPMLGALMMHELGEPPKSYMESTIILSISAMVGFVIYYELIEPTYLEYATNSGAILAVEWLAEGYHSWQIGTGIVIGIVAGGLCTMVLITIGITKQIFFRLRFRLARFPALREILPPTLGGLIVGLCNWALPLTVGNGNVVFSYIVKYGTNGDVSQQLLLCTGFTRMVLLGVSMNCGFVGGLIFPFLTMGMIAGTVMYVNFPYVPKGLCLAAFMVALPSGIVPMPFTFVSLVVCIYYFGLYQISPLFVAAITSYLVVSGSGLFKKLTSRALPASSAQAAAAGGAGSDGALESGSGKSDAVKGDDFALKQYMGNNNRRMHTESVGDSGN
jgi:H+/Cl- antiporter ClcA